MGMSASQARLLTLTSRLHDVELKAQHIQSQKIALATQKDAVYQEYYDALDAKALKVNLGINGETQLVDANFNSLCNYHKGVPKNYALMDNKTGKILVNEKTAEIYKQYGSDKYAFAFAMMGVMPDNNDYSNLGSETDSQYWQTIKNSVESPEDDPNWQDALNNPDGEEGDTANSNKTYTIAMTDTEKAIYNALIESDEEKYADLKSKFEAFNKATDPKEKKKAYGEFRKELMSKAAEEIFKALACKCNKENAEWDKCEFDHYTQLWDAIEEAGGCTVIEPQYEGGDAGTAWFKAAVESGSVTVRAYNESGHAKEWSDTSFATSTNSNYLQEVDDKTMEKKAEAKYEHELSIINAKDTKFDTELKNLETERTALTTEIDSIKKVEKDNIDRTFGIFS